MSADNYYMIRRHPRGGYTVMMGFMSVDDSPTPSMNDKRFENLVDAVKWGQNQDSEYGIIVHEECY